MSRPVAAYQLANSRREARHESNAETELRAARDKERKLAQEAREVLRDAIAASGVSSFAATAILAAAYSMAKAQMAAHEAAESASSDAHPADVESRIKIARSR